MKDPAKTASKKTIRKVPSPAVLKHGPQLEKLQQKAILASAVMDTIRGFVKQKAVLERDCAAATQKLITQTLARKDFTAYYDLMHGPGVRTSATAAPSPDSLTLAEFWKSNLVQLQTQQESKILSCDEIIRAASEEMKYSKAAGSTQMKQALDTAIEVQGEINNVVDLINRSKKMYAESETVIQDMNRKLVKQEEKFKKRQKGSKNSEEISEAIHNVTPKAISARNEYILSLTGANSQLARYYTHDLPYIIDMMSSKPYERMRDFLSSTLVEEELTAKASHHMLTRLLGQVGLLSIRKDIESLMVSNAIFMEPVQFPFEPVTGDTNSSISLEGDAALAMDKCALKWTMKLVENDVLLKTLTDQTRAVIAEHAETTTVDGKSDLEGRLSTLRESMRRSTNFQCKAKAILDVLGKAGVDVETWMESARAALEKKAIAAEKEAEPAPAGSTGETPIAAEGSVPFQNNNSPLDTDPNSICIALYDYNADMSGELTVAADEELILLNDSADYEWILVENSAGVRGYIPKNYVCFPAFESGTDHVPTPETWDSGVSGESRAVSANTDVDSNAGWDIPQENIRHTGVVDEYFPDEDMRGDTEPGKHPEMYIPQEWGHETEIEIVATDAYGVATSTFEERTADDPQTITTVTAESGESGGLIGYCRALFDFSSEDPEDLSFNEGDVIGILHRINGDVDDGYWTGELNGRIGLFMSGLTEETDDLGHPTDANTFPRSERH